MKREGTGTAQFAKNVGIGSGVTLGLILIQFAVLAMLMQKEILQRELSQEFVLGSIFLGSLIGGWISAKKQGRLKVQTALTVSLVLGIVICFGFIVADDGSGEFQNLAKSLISLVAGGACGGILSGSPKRRKYRK